jgi:prepilin-type N-terminal cleavage/methylation domain-containing protein
MTRRKAGFSLVEMLVTLTVLAMVMAALMVVLIGSQRSKMSTEGRIEAQQSGRAAVDEIAGDLRCAGYGVDGDAAVPQPAFAYVDSNELILYANLQPVAYRTSAAPSTTNPPLAPDPAGTPLPSKVSSGSAYPAGYMLPSTKWHTGAEMVRYTLDLNNDGVVNASDQQAAEATDAQRSMNPNDFVLAREVYGDSCGTTPTAHNNGGTLEKVALVRGPGAGVPHLFTVYLGSNPTPWDWANGAIPPGRLNEISRIVINVTTESRSPDRGGTYARSTITTEVNSLRNVPQAGTTTYQVDGYVYNDLDLDTIKDAGEPGIPNVVMRLGTAAIAQTNSLGYFIFSVGPGDYMLKQDMPEGYGPVTADTFRVNLVANPANVTHSFADSAMAGGWILDTTWVDTDGDHVRDPGEELMDGVEITVGDTTKITDGTGAAEFFVPPGSYVVSAAPPDSFVVTSTNPLTRAVADGSTVVANFGLVKGTTGTVTGKVYRDLNRNGAFDTGETGMAGVWVAVTKNAGIDVLGFAYTDANGNYSIDVPNNDPDHVTPYQVTYQVPAGYFPMGVTVIQPIWLSVAQVIANQNFGVQSFTVITLTADRVLSLASTDLIEKDWSGNDNQYASKGHADADLILGSEWVSNPNISVWFNSWDTAPYFSGAPTYQKNAQSSALSIAVGTLDNSSPTVRPDVVTGLHTYASGNIAVWLTMNSGGNLGYLPAAPTYYKTQDNGDVNAVLVGLCDNNTSLDLIVGTKSYANTGTMEIWTNNSGAGTFTRDEIYPTNGGVPAGGLGEVHAMALGNFDADTDSDLVVVTKTSDLHGKVHVFEKVGTAAGNRYTLRFSADLTGEGNAVTVFDVDRDGRRDFVIGTKTNANSGKLEYWHNDGSFSFSNARTVNAPGIVLSLGVGDFGGQAPRQDLAVGFRDNESAYTGGVRIYYTDLGTIPSFGTDPASGAANFMTPAINVNNFNFGANPAPSGTALMDLALAQKPTSTTGQVLVIYR